MVGRPRYAIASGASRRDRARDCTAGVGQGAGQGAAARATKSGPTCSRSWRNTRLRAIGVKCAWRLDKELFGRRRFANRLKLAGSLGLAPMFFASGDGQVEQGIRKAGNKRVRAWLVELAWSCLRLQSDSNLSQWFNLARRAAASARGAWASWLCQAAADRAVALSGSR